MSLGVQGHETVIERFRQTLVQGRLASTYLLVGPKGVGKRHFATRLAWALLCTERADEELSFCGECESCHLAAAGNHPDLLTVEKPVGKSTLPLDLFIGSGDQRNRVGLCHDLALRPMVSSRRVALIDDVDHFSIESANCLLKTLEEPPPRSVIFLVGTSLARQLPTIRSRSQVIRFGLLTEEEVTTILQEEPLQEDGERLSAEEAERLAALADGSIAGAMAASDEGMDTARRALLACLDVPRVDPSRLAKVLEEETKAAGSEASARRARLGALMTVAVSHYRNRLRALAESSGAKSSGAGQGGVSPEMDTTIEALEQCLAAETAIGRNANQTALIQNLAIELGRID